MLISVKVMGSEDSLKNLIHMTYTHTTENVHTHTHTQKTYANSSGSEAKSERLEKKTSG